MTKFLAISYRIIGALIALRALIIEGVTIGLNMPQWVTLIPSVTPRQPSRVLWGSFLLGHPASHNGCWSFLYGQFLR
jgi:hypothetical protein